MRWLKRCNGLVGSEMSGEGAERPREVNNRYIPYYSGAKHLDTTGGVYTTNGCERGRGRHVVVVLCIRQVSRRESKGRLYRRQQTKNSSGHSPFRYSRPLQGALSTVFRFSAIVRHATRAYTLPLYPTPPPRQGRHITLSWVSADIWHFELLERPRAVTLFVIQTPPGRNTQQY